MGIPLKDTKILWSRAFGRCSICQKRLVTEASKAVPSEATVVGEECHIVGESKNGPRGESILKLKDRNRYPNLILLCREHHKIVDDDPSAWPIELLHQTKANHEVWAESLVEDEMANELDRIYGDFVNFATEALHLHHWEWVTDHAIRDLVRQEVVDGFCNFVVRVARTNWPKKHPVLESAIQNLAKRVEDYVTKFRELTYLTESEWYREDRRWKGTWVDDYDERAENSKLWEKACGVRLTNVTVALNEYADAVRKTLNPTYFLHEGKFFIADKMGVTNHMEPVVYFPTEYGEAN